MTPVRIPAGNQLFSNASFLAEAEDSYRTNKSGILSVFTANYLGKLAICHLPSIPTQDFILHGTNSILVQIMQNILTLPPSLGTSPRQIYLLAHPNSPRFHLLISIRLARPTVCACGHRPHLSKRYTQLRLDRNDVTKDDCAWQCHYQLH